MLLLLLRRRCDRTLSHAPTRRKTKLGVISCFLMCDEYKHNVGTYFNWKSQYVLSRILNGLAVSRCDKKKAGNGIKVLYIICVCHYTHIFLFKNLLRDCIKMYIEFVGFCYIMEMIIFSLDRVYCVFQTNQRFRPLAGFMDTADIK